MKTKIRKAEMADLEAILKLQCDAYQTLAQTLDELTAEFNKGLILKATQNGEIIGSVRAYADGDTVYIGKLMVHPYYRGKGLGKRLLAEIEGKLHKKRFELFTSGTGEHNLRLFEKSGYTRFREETDASGIQTIYMEKKYDDGSYLAYGMIFGMMAGVVMGTLTDNQALWISIGMCSGMCFSLVYKSYVDKKPKK